VMKRYRIIHNFVCSQQTISGMQDLIPGDHCESGKFSCLISPVRVGCASIHHSRLPFKRCITVLVQCIRGSRKVLYHLLPTDHPSSTDYILWRAHEGTTQSSRSY
jgi:hypothetical protein